VIMETLVLEWLVVSCSIHLVDLVSAHMVVY
jgi:hypothetical protein